MKLVIDDLKKLLGKNALLMSFIAFLCTFMALFFTDEGSQEINKVIDIIKIDGILILFVIFGIELAKNTLAADKISKKLEFLLANGFPMKKILGKYFISIYISSFIILLPSLVLNLLKVKLSYLVMLNLILSSLLYTLVVVLTILDTINMNKINSLHIRLVGLFIGIMIISSLVYNFTNKLSLYLLSKFFVLVSINLFLGIKTNKERIVVSYY
ncbi:hypothetical protein HKO22_00995 [Peptoniphilus sp. AGMB00490]|uniref:ABC-2 family transporter protein n=1 Tax=Peptoniphilus faecalis TaxID=2731255 RepID=A0A848RFU0_9FIRM|nr:hypothetical protein [Peptoniphilus faecalis]NMW84319.1 hypothetical protein [Peptoniphilus faecalis]